MITTEYIEITKKLEVCDICKELKREVPMSSFGFGEDAKKNSPWISVRDKLDNNLLPKDLHICCVCFEEKVIPAIKKLFTL